MLTIEITHANWVTLRSISELSISHMNSLSMVPLWQGLRKLGLRTDSEFVSMPFATPSKHAKVSGASLLWFCRNFFFWHKRQIHFIYFLFFKNTNSQINIVTLWYHQNVLLGDFSNWRAIFGDTVTFLYSCQKSWLFTFCMSFLRSICILRIINISWVRNLCSEIEERDSLFFLLLLIAHNFKCA